MTPIQHAQSAENGAKSSKTLEKKVGAMFDSLVCTMVWQSFYIVVWKLYTGKLSYFQTLVLILGNHFPLL